MKHRTKRRLTKAAIGVGGSGLVVAGGVYGGRRLLAARGIVQQEAYDQDN